MVSVDADRASQDASKVSATKNVRFSAGVVEMMLTGCLQSALVITSDFVVLIMLEFILFVNYSQII